MNRNGGIARLSSDARCCLNYPGEPVPPEPVCFAKATGTLPEPDHSGASGARRRAGGIKANQT